MKINFKQLKLEQGTPIIVWSADSTTEPIKHYVILIADQDYDTNAVDYRYICTCKGFQLGNGCWHVEKAQEDA